MTEPRSSASGRGTSTASHERVPNDVRRARTRSAILDAAESRIIERGYVATTIDSLGPLAGVSKGAVYFHFSSKEDLLLALLERSRDSVFAPALDGLRGSGSGPTARIIGYFNGIGSLTSLGRYLLPVLVSVQGEGIPGEARDALAALQHDVLDALTEAITSGLASGEMGSPLDAEVLANLVLALMDGMLLRWHQQSSSMPGEDFLRAGRHAVLGLLSPPRRDG